MEKGLLESRKRRIHKGIKDCALGTGKRNVCMRYALRGHLNHNDIIVALPGFFLRQTNPGDLVGRMQAIGEISPVEFLMFTHDVTTGGQSSLTNFEHLHWRDLPPTPRRLHRL